MRMSLRERIRRALHYGDPSVEAVLAACPPDCPVTLNFTDRERRMRDLGCRIAEVGKTGALLRLDEAAPAADFNGEKCHIYFKLPDEALAGLRFSHDPVQNGFLFKSMLLQCDADEDGLAECVRIALPRAYTRRELRSHERYRVAGGMVSDMELKILPGASSGAGAGAPLSFRLAPGEPASLRIINLSAGGARLSIENTDFIEELASLDQKNLLLRLELNIAEGEKQENYIICGCVGSSYSIRLRRHTLRLRFLNTRSLRGATAADVEPRIEQWLRRQFSG